MKTALLSLLLLAQGPQAFAFYQAECRSIAIFSKSDPRTWACPERTCEVSWEYNEDTQYYDAHITPECRLPTTKYVFPSQQGTTLAHFWFYQFTIAEWCYDCRKIR